MSSIYFTSCPLPIASMSQLALWYSFQHRPVPSIHLVKRVKVCEDSVTEVSFLHTTFLKSAVRVRDRQMDIQTYRQMDMQSDRQTVMVSRIIEVHKDAESGW